MFLPLPPSWLFGTLRMIELTFRPLKKSVVPPSQNVRPLPAAENCALERVEVEEERIVEQARGQPAATRYGVVLAGPAARNEMPLRYSLMLWTPIPFGAPKRAS